MGLRFFSDKTRPVHLGPYPLERLSRIDSAELADVPAMQALDFNRLDTPHSLVNAMGEYQAMMDAIRDGLINKAKAGIHLMTSRRTHQSPSRDLAISMTLPWWPRARNSGSLHASQGTLAKNPDIERLAARLEDQAKRQTLDRRYRHDHGRSQRSRWKLRHRHGDRGPHPCAYLFLYEYPRDPEADEPGAEWLDPGCPGRHRACLRATETATVSLPTIFACLGHPMPGHIVPRHPKSI